ncbi:hypothetical protein AGMMS49942_23080 [Spirochaetia bacterium]|nr:hypothetical protein AGMMS49942_23080 [Spirochaetia bacterium]
MEVAIEYVHTAFRHDCTKEDIQHAVLNWLYDDLWDEETDKHLLIGFDRNGNTLEIMYNVVDDQKMKVFHAMPCRNIYLPLIDQRRSNARFNR